MIVARKHKQTESHRIGHLDSTNGYNRNKNWMRIVLNHCQYHGITLVVGASSLNVKSRRVSISIGNPDSRVGHFKAPSPSTKWINGPRWNDDNRIDRRGWMDDASTSLGTNTCRRRRCRSQGTLAILEQSSIRVVDMTRVCRTSTGTTPIVALRLHHHHHRRISQADNGRARILFFLAAYTLRSPLRVKETATGNTLPPPSKAIHTPLRTFCRQTARTRSVPETSEWMQTTTTMRFLGPSGSDP